MKKHLKKGIIILLSLIILSILFPKKYIVKKEYRDGYSDGTTYPDYTKQIQFCNGFSFKENNNTVKAEGPHSYVKIISTNKFCVGIVTKNTTN